MALMLRETANLDGGDSYQSETAMVPFGGAGTTGAMGNSLLPSKNMAGTMQGQITAAYN